MHPGTFLCEENVNINPSLLFFLIDYYLMNQNMLLSQLSLSISIVFHSGNVESLWSIKEWPGPT